METTRQSKIARLIQKDLSNIFQAETRMMKGVLVSVSIVRVSPDLSVAKVYLSIFPSSRAEEIITNVNKKRINDISPKMFSLQKILLIFKIFLKQIKLLCIA